MNEFDFDLDHLDFDGAQASNEAKLAQAMPKRQKTPLPRKTTTAVPVALVRFKSHFG